MPRMFLGTPFSSAKRADPSAGWRNLAREGRPSDCPEPHLPHLQGSAPITGSVPSVLLLQAPGTGKSHPLLRDLDVWGGSPLCTLHWRQGRGCSKAIVNFEKSLQQPFQIPDIHSPGQQQGSSTPQAFLLPLSPPSLKSKRYGLRPSSGGQSSHHNWGIDFLAKDVLRWGGGCTKPWKLPGSSSTQGSLCIPGLQPSSLLRDLPLEQLPPPWHRGRVSTWAESEI